MKQNKEYEEPIVTGWITDSDDPQLEIQYSGLVGSVVSSIYKSFSDRNGIDVYQEVSVPDFDKCDISKGVSDLNQSSEEIKQENIFRYAVSGKWEIIEPPYSPQGLADLLNADEVHYRAVTTKVTDSVGRAYNIDSHQKVIEDSELEVLAEGQEAIPKSLFTKESNIIKEFLRECNPRLGFEEVIKCAAQDREAIGWGAIEVTRNPVTKRIQHIQHIPAARIKVLRNWEGFVEERKNSGAPQYIYYQNFGEKVGVDRTIPMPDGTKYNYFETFDPHKHKALDSSEVRWNLVDKNNGMPTNDLSASANEIIWLVNSHPNTIYYGYSDVVPALSPLLTNTRIKDYTSQFFQNNTVPRYAVIIRGANVDSDFRKMITEYFSKEVRGNYHKTMILSLPNSSGKQVEVKFEKIEADRKEADFLETYRANSQAIQVAHGTSPAILGIAESSELGSGKGLSQAELYKDRIVTPRQKYWENQLYKMLSRGLGIIHSYLRFDPYDVRDMQMQSIVHRNYIELGVIDINEARSDLGYPPVPGGNVNFVKGASGTILKIKDLNELPTSVVDFSTQPQDSATETEDTPPDPNGEQA